MSYDRYKELLRTFDNKRLNQEIENNMANRRAATPGKAKNAWQKMLDASLEIQKARDNVEMTSK